MKANLKSTAFTMVELLAVIGIMSVIVALTVPNGIFVRHHGSEQVVKVYAEAMTTAMGKIYGMYGIRGQAEWIVKYRDTRATVEWLAPLLGNNSADEIIKSLEGYTLLFPPNISGTISITRNEDGALIYP